MQEMTCLQFEEQIFAYIDGMLDADSTARFLAHKEACAACRAALEEAESFEAGMFAALAPVEPPAGFAEQVMAKIAAEPAVVQPAAKVVKFPRRGIFATIGTVAAAAAIALAVGVADMPAEQPPVQMAEDPPAIVVPVEPKPVVDEQPVVEKPVVSKPVAKPAPEVKPEPEEVKVTVADIDLPQASFGAGSEGEFSLRMVAALEGTDIYSPSLSADAHYATFYTRNEDVVYLWRSDLIEPGEPVLMDHCSLDGSLPATAAYTNAQSAIISPDHSMLASNTKEGVWCSALGDNSDMWQLTEIGGGNLLTWSPNSAKILFTDAEGALFVGYPLEKLVLPICAGPVADIAWGADNSTVVFTTDADGVLELFTVIIP